MTPAVSPAAVAAEVAATLGSGRQIAPFTSRAEGLTLDVSYRALSALNALAEARGAKRLGRKIGFTNRLMWAQYGVRAPIWGYLYDTTVHDLAATPDLSLDLFAEPRIEPEIVFGLSVAPSPAMDERTLLGCIGWVAHGFEIVQSIYPRWTFGAPDTVAANGVHGALLIGPRHPVPPQAAQWQAALPHFDIELCRDGVIVERGSASNVLDGPVSALRHLVQLLADDPDNPPLAAGEIVTTGTLTLAPPAQPGETWTTALRGIPLEGLRLRLT